jgi:glycosyltransferase involved in cell wall biosynthesis
MNISIRQIRGNSGIDVWAQNLCSGIRQSGHNCTLDLKSPIFEIFPGLLSLSPPEQHTDIIHGNSWNAYAFKNEMPLVVTEHHVVHDPAYDPYRTLPQKAYHRLIYRYERRSLDMADAVTCDCEYTKKKLEEVFGCYDSHLVYVGIDNVLFKPVDIKRSTWNIPEDKTLLFFAGNLSKRKGADLLPAIMNQLGDEYILLLASGQQPGSLTGCKNILNPGRLSLNNLVEVYNLCDIFLTASRLEGFGLSVAEAMACGKPVIATNTSSLPELVVDGKGGFLCEMDNVMDFADKITLLAGDEALRHEMGVFNRRRVEENFTIEKMTKEYVKIYQSILR